MLFKIVQRKQESDIKYGSKQERIVRYSTKKPMQKHGLSKSCWRA